MRPVDLPLAKLAKIIKENIVIFTLEKNVAIQLEHN